MSFRRLLMEHLKEKQKKYLELLAAYPRDTEILNEWWDAELIYTSNAIEGNTLTRTESALVLEKGITIGGKPLKDHLEVIDHRDALHYVKILAQKNQVIRESDVRDLHQLVVARSLPSEAGRYSQFQRRIKGSDVVFPSPVKIPALMQEFGDWLKSIEITPLTAFESHWKLIEIHPFTDGNGRTARLLMNLILLRAGYPPLLIGPDERPEYLKVIQERQNTGDKSSYESFMATRLNSSLDTYISKIIPQQELHTTPNKIKKRL